jgi:hypothetical protein
MNILCELESLVRVLTRSVQMPIAGLAVAFFIMLRRSPVGVGGKVVGFCGLSVLVLNCIDSR